MRMLLTVLAVLLMAAPAFAQRSNRNTLPPACTAANLLTTCVPQRQGVRARVVDADTSTVCVNTGSGSTAVTCEFDGSAWIPVTSGTWVGANGDSINNTADGTFRFRRDEAGTITINVLDDTNPTDLLIDSGTTGSISIGSDDTSALILTVDTDVQIINGATGVVTLDMRDYADTDDDDMPHVLFSTNCTTTGAGVEDCDLTISTTEAGANQVRIFIDGDGGITFSGGDLSLIKSETSSFGAPNKMTASSSNLNQYIGIPRLNVTHIAVLTDGTTSVAVATPTLAACNAIVNGTETDDTSLFITGSSSYKYVWQATVAADDGIDCVIAYPAVNDPTRLGFWFRTDAVIVSGDIDINFDDGGVTDGTFSTFSTTVVNEWQWVELDITTACSADCSAVDGIEFLATAQAASGTDLDGVAMYIDQLAMWKAASDEVAIGNIRIGGLIDFSYAPTGQGSANTRTKGVEWTSHFITYNGGADAIISITDLSGQYGTTLEAL